MLFDSFSRKELFHEFIHVFDPWESALIGLQLNNFCARYIAGKKHEACFPNFQSVIFFKNLRESDRINKCWKLRDFSDCCSTRYSRKGFNSKVFNESSLINFIITERFRILLFKIVAITVAWKYGCIGEARNYWSVPCTYITWPVSFFFISVCVGRISHLPDAYHRLSIFAHPFGCTRIREFYFEHYSSCFPAKVCEF